MGGGERRPGLLGSDARRPRRGGGKTAAAAGLAALVPAVLVVGWAVAARGSLNGHFVCYPAGTAAGVALAVVGGTAGRKRPGGAFVLAAGGCGAAFGALLALVLGVPDLSGPDRIVTHEWALAAVVAGMAASAGLLAFGLRRAWREAAGDTPEPAAAVMLPRGPAPPPAAPVVPPPEPAA